MKFNQAGDFYISNIDVPSQIILSCLAALAAAAPQFQEEFRPDYRPIAILRDEREDYGDGNFRYEFETENGILVNAVGTPGSQGQSNIQGFYRWVLSADVTLKTSSAPAPPFFLLSIIQSHSINLT